MRWLILLLSVTTAAAGENAKPGSLRDLLATGKATWVSPEGEAGFERREARREHAVRFEVPQAAAIQVGDAAGWAISPRWVVTKLSLLPAERLRVNGIPVTVKARWEEEDLALLELEESLPASACLPNPGVAKIGDLVAAGDVCGVISRGGAGLLAADLAIPVKSLGGPVMNLRGEVVGIAMRATEWKTTEVLPADRIWGWVKSLRAADSKF